MFTWLILCFKSQHHSNLGKPTDAPSPSGNVQRLSQSFLTQHFSLSISNDSEFSLVCAHLTTDYLCFENVACMNCDMRGNDCPQYSYHCRCF